MCWPPSSSACSQLALSDACAFDESAAGALSRAAAFVYEQKAVPTLLPHGRHLLRELRLSDVALNHARLVVDCYQRRLGLDAENLSQLLELQLAATLSCQGGNRTLAMNSGEPLSTVAPRDPYLREVAALAEQLLGRGAGGAKDDAGGLLARILGRT